MRPKTVFAAALVASVATPGLSETDKYQGCLAYNKPVTLTGTVLLRKIHYEKSDDMPPEGSISFPLLVLDPAAAGTCFSISKLCHELL
jgi:hypothetical protein